MKNVGRIIVREDAVGMFINFGKASLDAGIYDITDIDGELIVVFKGKTHLQEEHFMRSEALNVEELFHKRPYSMMSKKEISEVNVTDYERIIL